MKKWLLVFAGVVVVYITTFAFFAQNQLAKQLTSDTHSTYPKNQWTDSINVISNVDLPTLRKIFDHKNVSIELVRVFDPEEIRAFWFRENIYNYAVFVESFWTPYIQVSEYENFEEYGASWERKYIWCFFLWIKTEDKMTGIS
jgi:hypothetical protein